MAALSRRRLAALAVLVLVAVGAVVVAIGIAGSDDAPSVPEGGSSFGSTTTSSKGQTLLDALAPLLAAGSSAPVIRLPTSSTPAKPRRPKPPAAQAQRLAQLFLVGFQGTTREDPFLERLALRRWGAVIVDGSNFTDEAQLQGLTDQLVSVMRSAGEPVPLIATAQGGAPDSALKGLGPAPQRTIGSLAEARAEATRASRKLRRLGVRMSLAPSADIGYSGAAWDGRAFGDDPAAVARRVTGAIAGWRTGGVAPALGHFPGEGAASQDPGDGPASVGLTLDDLQRTDLMAFRGAPLRTAPALVLSNALYQAFDNVTPATLVPEVPALARRMGFEGTIVSGNLAATVLASGTSIADAAVQALKAGCDLLWIPGNAPDQEAAYRAVVGAVRRGEISQKRVRSALAHVAALKRKFAAS